MSNKLTERQLNHLEDIDFIYLESTRQELIRIANALSLRPESWRMRDAIFRAAGNIRDAQGSREIVQRLREQDS